MATALVALGRWGLGVRILGVVGGDPYSDRILADLHDEQVDTDRVVRSPDAEGRRSTILVDHRHGTRCVIGGPHRIPPLPMNAIEPAALTGARVLHLDTTCDECAIEAAELARSLGIKVTLDAERVTPRIDSLLPLCDVVIASYDFAREITGQEKLDRAAYGLFLRSERPTIVTNGAHGCEYVAQGVQLHQPAYPCPVVDGTGAGDVFHAAYIYALLSAFDVKKTLRFAAWAAAHVCRELGGRKGIPTHDEVREFLRSDSGNGDREIFGR
jgi:sugar/nucleoside kinase (ribokinase family)